MRVSELDPRVKNKRFFLPFLTLGTSTKLLGFMRVLAILDPLEISSGGQLFRPPTYPKGGKVSENLSARTRVSVLHRRERQLAAPGRELTAEALRRCVAARANSRDARTGARAVIETSPRVRGRGRLLRERSQKGPSEANGADVYYPLDQARPSAAGPWPDWPSRLFAFRKGGKVSKNLSARTRASESIKRGASRRSVARRDSGGTPQRRECECLRKEYPGGGW